MFLKLVIVVRVFLFAMFLFLPSLIVLLATGFWKPWHQYFASVGIAVLLINMALLFTRRGKGVVARGVAQITGR